MKEAGGKATKSNWFKKEGATNVLILPATPESELAKAVEVALARTTASSGLVAKVVEEPGPSVRASLVKSSPFPGPPADASFAPGWLQGRSAGRGARRGAIGRR